MYSVDLAARAFFSHLNCDFDLLVTQTGMRRGARFLRTVLSDSSLLRKRKQFGRLCFTLIEDARHFERYSHVVYWGDFLNNPVYRKIFSEVDVRLKHSGSTEAAIERWFSLYLHAGRKRTGTVISVGGNFQNQLDASDPEVSEAYRYLGENFDAIMPRDEFSTSNLSASLSRTSRPHIKQGLDCAFLLEPSPRKNNGTYFAHHFGRSGFKNIHRLISEVERLSGLKARALDGWLAADPKTVDRQFARNRELIAGAAFVLSDTYHVCVNSLSCRVPVYGLGRTSSKQVGTLGDFKKGTLFSMFQADDRYFVNPDLPEEDYFATTAKAIAEFEAEQGKSWEQTFALLDQKIASFRADVSEALAT
jgi:hypothetical protein